jgi:hypothetical protein
MSRGILIIIVVLAMLSLVLPPSHVVANDPQASERHQLRLKSGGVASQQESDDLLSSGEESAEGDGLPVQWSKNVDVFAAYPFERDEPTIAVNPRDEDNIVVGNHERQGPAFPAAIVCAFSASFDQGNSWARYGSTPLQGALFPAANGHSCSDSVLAVDRSGDFYFAYLDLFRATSPLRVDLLVAKSSDGGQSFPTGVLVVKGIGSGPGAEDPDKEWIEADRQPRSPFRGNVYVTYSDFFDFTIKFRKSVNGGVSFTPAPTAHGTVVSDEGFSTVSALFNCGTHQCFTVTTRYMQGSNISVGPKGEIHVVYGDFTEIETFDHTLKDEFVNAVMTAAKIRSATSTDEGLTWSRSTVRDMCSPAPCRSAGTDSAETKNTPVFRVGTTPFTSVGPDKNVYAVWAEWDSVTFSFDPGTNRDFAVSGGKIMFARSLDGGVTWQPAILINDDTTQRDKFFPAMYVGPGGNIQIVWADRRLDPNGVNYDIFSATSVNSGTSFQSNVRVTTKSSNPRGTRFIGDYIDIRGAREEVHTVWTDRRSVATTASSAANKVFTARRLEDDD